ncbi:Uncharacterised protein [Chryseobacterium nakagawai]|uniref:Uncharacterized protein n=1 Tax=Chryseobacterium nakagawai TaxID=1241982 RepID=A0AAD1DT42_CHRNA|nr:hypothetical protein [Chryseobacterium nakagawai]AZA93456.1 hypothetical protein EG343_24015 [Chryseobacterium nakagawai]VEH20136.1 Uncharacterised protein [Chryseobacterium nakagawai]
MKKLLIVAALGVFTLGFSQNYYNDYRGSVSSINWGQVAIFLGLNRSQINQMTVLNNRYPDYNSWNHVYAKEPNRWYNDRYYEIERIMTPEQYKKFYSRYYNGQNPRLKYDNDYRRYQNRPQMYDRRFDDHHDRHREHHG